MCIPNPRTHQALLALALALTLALLALALILHTEHGQKTVRRGLHNAAPSSLNVQHDRVASKGRASMHAPSRLSVPHTLSPRPSGAASPPPSAAAYAPSALPNALPQPLHCVVLLHPFPREVSPHHLSGGAPASKVGPAPSSLSVQGMQGSSTRQGPSTFKLECAQGSPVSRRRPPHPPPGRPWKAGCPATNRSRTMCTPSSLSVQATEHR